MSLTPTDSLEVPTPAQLRVLQLAASGLTNKEIAVELGITYGVVRDHVHLASQRYGVAGREQAVLTGIALGDITAPGVRREHPTLDERLDRIETQLTEILTLLRGEVLGEAA